MAPPQVVLQYIKNPWRGFIRVQKRIEYHLPHYQIPQPSPPQWGPLYWSSPDMLLTFAKNIYTDRWIIVIQWRRQGFKLMGSKYFCTHLTPPPSLISNLLKLKLQTLQSTSNFIKYKRHLDKFFVAKMSFSFVIFSYKIIYHRHFSCH